MPLFIQLFFHRIPQLFSIQLIRPRLKSTAGALCSWIFFITTLLLPSQKAATIIWNCYTQPKAWQVYTVRDQDLLGGFLLQGQQVRAEIKLACIWWKHANDSLPTTVCMYRIHTLLYQLLDFTYSSSSYPVSCIISMHSSVNEFIAWLDPNHDMSYAYSMPCFLHTFIGGGYLLCVDCCKYQLRTSHLESGGKKSDQVHVLHLSWLEKSAFDKLNVLHVCWHYHPLICSARRRPIKICSTTAAERYSCSCRRWLCPL